MKLQILCNMIKMPTKKTFGALALFIGVSLLVWFLYNQFWVTEEFQDHDFNPRMLFVPIACIAVGWKWLRDEGKGIEEVTPPDLKCKELDDAKKRAQETMPSFLEQVERNVEDAYVRFPLKPQERFTEHIWGYVHFFRDGLFNVSLANDPHDSLEASTGRRDIAVADVEDWQIMQPDGSIKGAFSLIALFEYRENLGLKLSPRMKKQKAVLLDAALQTPVQRPT